ncbi:MAG: putative selenocysteine system protein [Candidatus Helarchaeota archaeon]
MESYPNRIKKFELDLSPSLAFDVLYYTINNSRSYCIKLEETIETDEYTAEALIALNTCSAEQLLAKIKGNYEGETILSVWSYEEQNIKQFLIDIEVQLRENLENLNKCDAVQIHDLRSGITILKELDRVYYATLQGEKVRRIYFMIADSRERLYKIMIKGRYGSFNPALIEMQTYLGMLLRHNQDSIIKEPESIKVGLASLKWKGWIIVLLKEILNLERK